MKNPIKLSLLYILFISLSTLSYGQDFKISNYQIELDINTDGSFNIVETIDVNFSKKKRGIYRSIPYGFKNNNEYIDLGITDIKVNDHPYKLTKKRGVVEIRIGDKNIYVTGDQTYRISYKIQNGILDYPDHQELYFDLIGSDWKAEIAQLSYKINLPRHARINESDLKATTGNKGQNLDGLSIKQTTPQIIEGKTTRKLLEGEGATIAVKLPKTYLSVAELANNGYKQKLIKEEQEKVPQNPWLALIPMSFFVFFVNIWKKLFGKRHKNKIQETYAYPPEGLTSAHVGAYIDQVANTRDIVSLIPYWAGEGYITMQDIGEDTLLTMINPLLSDYPSYEHLVFDEIFKKGKVRSMSSLKDKFYTTLHKAKNDLSKEVHGQGYYKAEFIYWFRTWRLFIFPLSMFVLAAAAIAIYGQLPMGFTFIGLGVIGIFFGIGKLPLSDHGIEVKYKLDGLKQFLEEVPESEIEGIIKNDPKYFENMLPYAVAFGIEKGFIPKFESTMDHMPLWYTTTHNTNSFTTFQKGFSTETISSAFSTYPQSTSSGSSGGSFSSGGGSGGGGGGSW